MSIAWLRQEYHNRICSEIVRIIGGKKKGYPNFADGSGKSSTEIAWSIVKHLDCSKNYNAIKGQTVGDLFEELTKVFLEEAFLLLRYLRPGKWHYSTVQTAISGFDQYEHLAYLEKVVNQDRVLSAALGGDYIVKPDIVIGRSPVSDKEVNRKRKVVDNKVPVAQLPPRGEKNQKDVHPNLHASSSCKWTIRSDRSQNTRTEALNLIRNRKGHLLRSCPGESTSTSPWL